MSPFISGDGFLTLYSYVADFSKRFEDDARLRKQRLERQRKAQQKRIDYMARGGQRKNSYNPKTLQILKRKGLLDQNPEDVVDRLHKWELTTKTKKKKQADWRNKVDAITGTFLCPANLSFLT